MIKKNYVIPKTRVAEVDCESLIADSYVGIGGTGDADVKRQAFGWDDNCGAANISGW